MSHIPNAVMKHAGPVNHDAEPVPPKSAARTRPHRESRIGTGTWIALGGTLVVGAAAALAVPLLRARATPVPKRRGKRATTGKGKPRKTHGK